ncbi:MAG: KR domain-containing protein, partial [Lachnospiraceae bacterium]|nr:KR domain-containing protein [Lachnospiraceae bacterium]
MYLVIGANGFLGSYCIQSILEQTVEKIVATARNIQGLCDGERISWVECDITREEEFDHLVSVVKGCDRLKVIFLAAYHD